MCVTSGDSAEREGVTAREKERACVKEGGSEGGWEESERESV